MDEFADHLSLASDGYFEPGPRELDPCDAGPEWMRNPKTEADRLAQLIHVKAWEYLGVTGREFADGWVAGKWVGDVRPAVLSMARLMMTGRWFPPNSLPLLDHIPEQKQGSQAP